MKPYRKGVAAIIISKETGQILLGERTSPVGQWQLPQGGCKKHESFLEALHREVQEEVGVSNLKVIRETKEVLRYDWPEGLKPNSQYGGQEQIYFLLDGTDINVDKLQATEEFRNFGWFDIDKALSLFVPWKKQSILKAFEELKIT